MNSVSFFLYPQIFSAKLVTFVTLVTKKVDSFLENDTMCHCHVKTSTTLYITCIAGCQYNFIHITRILFNLANDIAGCQYNFIHITRILFNFANDIRH
jgi:DNA repair photolyase